MKKSVNCLLNTISTTHHAQKPGNDGDEGEEGEDDGSDGNDHCPEEIFTHLFN